MMNGACYGMFAVTGSFGGHGLLAVLGLHADMMKGIMAR
jgi:hypothetical protein